MSTRTDDAVMFIQEALGGGTFAKPMRVLRAKAATLGFSKYALYQASRILGVQRFNHATRGAPAEMWWSLPGGTGDRKGRNR